MPLKLSRNGFRYASYAAGIILIIIGTLFAWLLHEIHEGAKTDYWNRDRKPNAADLKRFEADGLPTTITRIIECGSSSRFRVKGERITIYCFPPSDVEPIKAALGRYQVDHEHEWHPGFPPGHDWRRNLQSFAPPDLMIPETAKASEYIYVSTEPRKYDFLIMDIARGISYDFMVKH